MACNGSSKLPTSPTLTLGLIPKLEIFVEKSVTGRHIVTWTLDFIQIVLPNYLQLADNGHQTHMFQSIFMTIIVQTVITYI